MTPEREPPRSGGLRGGHKSAWDGAGYDQSNPRRLIETLTADELGGCVSQRAFFGDLSMIEPGHFMCPICDPPAHTAPPARWLNAVLWECSRCKTRATRFTIERLILETPEYLDVLMAVT